jgi:uncharacterized protein (TIGR03118 family)
MGSRIRHAPIGGKHMKPRHLQLWSALGLTGALVLGASPADAHNGHQSRFVRTDLVSDVPGAATLTDANLVNAWGMAQGPTTPVWVAANGTNVATLYRGDGVIAPPANVGLVVSLPTDGPTGQVFNSSTDFVVSDGAGHSGPALFLFDSEAGDITGWNIAVPPPPPSTHAFNGAHVDGAIFKGLAIASANGKNYLYAADFHNNRIVVVDGQFQVQSWSGAFRDRKLPNGYAPFNIQALGGELYVTYAKQDADAKDEVAGRGKGFVDVFDTSGHLLRRLVQRGALNAPWGLALAPDGFGSFAGDLLVGNFGDGRINAYDPHNGHFRGTLRTADGHDLRIDGLWALLFGNGATNDVNTLVFSAGPDDEAHGLYGAITVAPPKDHDGKDD